MVNKIELVGKVVEIESREGSTKKSIPYVSGTIKVQTAPDNIISVDYFAQKINAQGAESPLYKSLQTVSKEYKTIATHGAEEADIIKIDSAQLNENIFSPDGKSIIRGFKVTSNFFNRKKEDVQNKFTIEGIFLSARDEIKDDIPTGTLIVSLLHLGYKNAPHVLDFSVSNPAGVQYIKNTLSEGQLLKLSGNVIVFEDVKEKVEAAAFGDPLVSYTRVTTRKLEVLSAGAPVDGSLSPTEIQTILATRESNIKQIKEDAISKGKTGSGTPAATGSPASFSL